MPDSPLSLLNDIKKFDNSFSIMKALLNYPFFHWVQEYFLVMRDYYSGLDFVTYCYSLICDHFSKISKEDFSKWDRELILLKLQMLDYLNEWQEYLDLFDKIRTEKSYTYTYMKFRNDDAFNKYVLSEDSNYKYVHFLYQTDYRYQIIQRKYSKQKQGKKTKYLERHQQLQLTEEELNERFKIIIQRLEEIANAPS